MVWILTDSSALGLCAWNDGLCILLTPAQPSHSLLLSERAWESLWPFSGSWGGGREGQFVVEINRR